MLRRPRGLRRPASTLARTFKLAPTNTKEARKCDKCFEPLRRPSRAQASQAGGPTPCQPIGQHNQGRPKSVAWPTETDRGPATQPSRPSQSVGRPETAPRRPPRGTNGGGRCRMRKSRKQPMDARLQVRDCRCVFASVRVSSRRLASPDTMTSLASLPPTLSHTRAEVGAAR